MDTTDIECFKGKLKDEIYKLAYSQMPKSAAAEADIKLHINGAFFYAHKTVVMSNALGILRHMNFCGQLPDCPSGLDNPPASDLPSPEEIKVLWDVPYQGKKPFFPQ